MLATLADPPLSGTQLVFEPKYDGIRALVEIEPARSARRRARVVAPRQREDVAVPVDRAPRSPRSAPRSASRSSSTARSSRSMRKGRPMGFQRLQGRIHLSDAKDVERIDREQPVAFIAFDLLREGNDDLRGLPLVERRARLERLFGRPKSKRARSASASRRRRRPRAARARAGRRMGRADRQGGAVAVPVGPAQPDVAQAQAPPRAGVRRRRLDRAAQHAPALRRAAARRYQGRSRGSGSGQGAAHS